MRLPQWLRTGGSLSAGRALKGLLRQGRLSTVCEEARCPNLGGCFGRGRATFLILGDVCTRGCGFCAVRKGAPGPPDEQEPLRLARTAGRMALKYVVITSVCRDDLPDGGAGHFARCIQALREHLAGVKVEVLVPDFGGSWEALRMVLGARPDVLNHNLETVPRLYGTVRPRASYRRSLELLQRAKAAGLCTKSGLMLGLGESMEEVLGVLRDLRAVGCDILTLGQYLRPTKGQLPVARYLQPGEFEALRQEALSMGFAAVAAGPLVRSSMNAEEVYGHV